MSCARFFSQAVDDDEDDVDEEDAVDAEDEEDGMKAVDVDVKPTVSAAAASTSTGCVSRLGSPAATSASSTSPLGLEEEHLRYQYLVKWRSLGAFFITYHLK